LRIDAACDDCTAAGSAAAHHQRRAGGCKPSRHGELSAARTKLASARTAFVKARIVNDEMQSSTGTLIDEMERKSGDAK